MTRVEFTVLGVPAPQGSKRHVGRGVLVESSKALGPWRDAVAWAARDAALRHGVTAPLDGPLRLRVEFRFPLPKARPKRVREVGRAWKTTQIDLDKCVRAVGDALTDSGLIADDARICEVHATKVEVTGWTGASITIETMGEL